MNDDEKTRRALENAKNGKGAPAKDVHRDLREILNLSAGENKPLYETASPEELADAIIEWATSHDPNTPVVLDDSREAIYDDDER